MFPLTKQKIGLGIQPKTTNHWNSVLPENHQFITLHCEAGVIPSIPMQLDTINAGGLRGTVPDRDRLFLDMKSDFVKIPFTMLANKYNLRYILARAFQSVTMGGAPNYQKVFKLANSTGVLSVKDNEGFLANIVSQTAGGDGWQAINCAIDDLTISIEKDAQGINRLVKLAGNFIGTEILFGKNFTGTWLGGSLYNMLFGYNNNPAEEFEIEGMLGDFDFEFPNKIWKKFELKINNRISAPFRTAGGKAGNLMFDPEVRFSITLLYDNDSKIILQKIQQIFGNQGDDNNSNLVVRNNYTGAGGEFKIELNNIVIDSNPLNTEGNLFMVTLSGICANSSANEPVKIYLTDGYNSYG